MARYAMVIDLQKCVGCQACAVACAKQWDVPLGFARTRIQSTGIVGTFPKLTSAFRVAHCNQCDRPSCVAACPTGATFRRRDGIVEIDHRLCIGCGYCVLACPYDARYVSPASKQADKCDFCAARLDRGLQPACVTTCTAHAKYFGDMEDSNSEVFGLIYNKGAGRIETSQAAIGPNVFYLGKKEHFNLLLASPEQLRSLNRWVTLWKRLGLRDWDFAPPPPQGAAAFEVWTRVLKPLKFLTLAAVGATFLGQAVALFRQRAAGESEPKKKEES